MATTTTDMLELFKDRIQTLAIDAENHFNLNEKSNIYEDQLDGFSIVKLLKDDNPIYFLLFEKLGAGSFGEVSRGIQIDLSKGSIIPNTDAAIKITDFSEQGTLSPLDRPRIQAETAFENDILKKINMSFGYSVGERVKKVTMILDEELSLEREALIEEAIVAMPLFPGRDIEHEAHKDKFSYGSLTFITLAHDLASSIQRLHDENIIHSDLKPANVIWDPKIDCCHIIDFNRAKILPSDSTRVYDTKLSDRNYMAPESLRHEKDKGFVFSKSSDIYSFGQILAEKFDISYTEQNKLAGNDYLGYDLLLLKTFIKQMLSEDETKRPTTEDCVTFFKTLQSKMELDLTDDRNPLRIKLGRKLIDLEIEINQLQQDISKASRFSSFFLSKKIEKLDEKMNQLQLIVQSLSSNPIDIALLHNSDSSIFKDERQKVGFFKKPIEKMDSSVKPGDTEKKDTGPH